MIRKRSPWLRTAAVRFFRPKVEELEARAVPATFTVVNALDSGPGSLRQAILDANATANVGGPDLIAFDIPGPGVHTITPTTDLPMIADPVVIDGYTQPGASVNTLSQGDNAVLQIELDAVNINNPGLWVSANDSTFRGLVINRAGGPAIQLDGNGNLVEGNYLGTDVTGTLALGNIDGVTIGGSDNAIGGTAPAERNIISGNSGVGISLGGGANQNTIQGNYIGTDATGTVALGNAAGVSIANQGSNNLIGGAAAGAGNVISANSGAGIDIDGYGGPVTGNTIEGNRIGTDATGTVALGNQVGVVFGIGAADNTIGGPAAGAGNLISGNTYVGIRLTNNGTTGNVVQGNRIGTTLDGQAALGNGQIGVYIDGAPGNLIGGTASGAGNLISGNGQYGILVAEFGTGVNNVIQGNGIGVNASVDAAIPNGLAGISTDAADTAIGGGQAGAGNVISGNSGDGVDVSGMASVVAGNYIGTDETGTIALGNSGDGVDVSGADNTIGGLTAAERNVISGNGGSGVRIASAVPRTTWWKATTSARTPPARQRCPTPLTALTSWTAPRTTRSAARPPMHATSFPTRAGQASTSVTRGRTTTSSSATLSARTPRARLPWARPATALRWTMAHRSTRSAVCRRANETSSRGATASG